MELAYILEDYEGLCGLYEDCEECKWDKRQYIKSDMISALN